MTGIMIIVRSVHPRVCGEHFSSIFFIFEMGGSSPRLRGTYYASHYKPAMHRFIPAFAGNMPYISFILAYCAVHPRVCGEHNRYKIYIPLTDGSSPRLRGTFQTKDTEHPKIRFIPAFAGNMNSSNFCFGTNPVHPRVCGEHPPI